MKYIFNTFISLVYAIIIAAVSSKTDEGFSANILHMALFDFFVVQIFLLVFEMFLVISSKEVDI